MSRMRLTQQEADPIGAITAAPLVAIGAGLAFVTSIVLTFAHWQEVGSPFAAVLGVALVAAAGLVAAISLCAVACAVLGRAAVAGRRRSQSARRSRSTCPPSAPTGTSTTTSARSSSAC